MKFIHIAYYTILRNLRDKSSMINMLLLPLLLIVVLGNALSNLYDIKDMDKTSVAVLNDDKSIVGTEFNKFLKNEEIEKILSIIPAESYEEGVTLLKQGKAKAFIMIENGTTKSLENGSKGQIKLYGDKSNEVSKTIVQNIVTSFINTANTAEAVAKLGGDPKVLEYKNMIEKKPISSEGKIPRAIDYYAVTMLVMILLYGAQYGVHGIAEDYVESMKYRLGSTPVPASLHVLGKSAGMIMTVFLQAIVIIVFTKSVYAVNWGSNYPLILFIAFTISAFAVMIGFLAVVLLGKRETASALVSTVIPIMTFISGGYARIVSDDKIYNTVKLFLPSNLGQTAYFNTIYGDSSSKTWFSLGALWVITLIITTFATLQAKRRMLC